MRHLLHLAPLLLALTACSDPDVSTQGNTKPAPAPVTSVGAMSVTPQALHPCFAQPTQDEKIGCLQRLQALEAPMCEQVRRLVDARRLLPRFEQDARSGRGGVQALRDLLRGPLDDDASAEYVLDHPAYIEIAQSLATSLPGAVYFGETGVYCGQTGLRLKEMELLGPSDAAWSVREKWLDSYLPLVRYPWIEPDNIEVFLQAEFERVKQLYNRPHDRVALLQWTRKAEQRFFELVDAAHHDDGTGLTREKNQAILRDWLRQMRAGL